jgi:hypothetical protein
VGILSFFSLSLYSMFIDVDLEADIVATSQRPL